MRSKLCSTHAHPLTRSRVSFRFQTAISIPQFSSSLDCSPPLGPHIVIALADYGHDIMPFALLTSWTAKFDHYSSVTSVILAKLQKVTPTHCSMLPYKDGHCSSLSQNKECPPPISIRLSNFRLSLWPQSNAFLWFLTSSCYTRTQTGPLEFLRSLSLPLFHTFCTCRKSANLPLVSIYGKSRSNYRECVAKLVVATFLTITEETLFPAFILLELSVFQPVSYF